jgi:hypothetical protein
MVENLLYRAHLNLASFGTIDPKALEDICLSNGVLPQGLKMRRASSKRSPCVTRRISSPELFSHSLLRRIGTIFVHSQRDARAPVAVPIWRQRFGRYLIGHGRKSVVLINETPEIKTPLGPPPCFPLTSCWPEPPVSVRTRWKLASRISWPCPKDGIDRAASPHEE